jgi:uncharacterized oxidoreductase
MIDLTKAQVLITGGSEGIGYGLATLFKNAGSEVLITGRQPQKLAAAATALPGLKTFANDIGDPTQREKLATHIKTTMPGINIVINNAGIQRRIALAQDTADWHTRQQEIDILLSGPVHLNHLLIPLLLAHGKPSLIINVTSGGAYIPQVFAPVYSACKAALHSYTMSLRHSLAGTSCNVVELIPPAVRTALTDPAAAHGATPETFCKTVFPKLIEEGATTVGFGPTAQLIPELSGQQVAALFDTRSSGSTIVTYADKS